MTDAPSRLRIAVLYGGRSSEHDVSVMSATNVMRALDPARYDAVPVYITRAGRWLVSRFDGQTLDRPEAGAELCLVPGGQGRALILEADGASRPLAAIDVLLPVLHGLDGEDGSIQGLARVAGIPLAGCDILGSATALDKAIAKRLLVAAGLPAARAEIVTRETEPGFAALVGRFGLPLFVKPARQGSSVGVSKVVDAAGYAAALAEGFRYDDKLLVEEFIKGREIECAVLEDADGSLFVSVPGEIVPAESHGFYSYDAKYIDADGAALHLPAQLAPEVEARLKQAAAEAFRALGCDGMARVDFFVTPDRILVNEVNTIPGFTNISMYPKAMEASGVSTPELIDRLVAQGLKRAGR